MTITVDRKTALKAVLMMFDALGPDGEVAGDIDRVEFKFLCPSGSGNETLVLYERLTRYARPVVTTAAAALMNSPLPPASVM